MKKPSPEAIFTMNTSKMYDVCIGLCIRHVYLYFFFIKTEEKKIELSYCKEM